MKKRIQKIIETEQLSHSKFADIIGVQRSSISHILSGRNNPSLDFIQRILIKFKKIDSDWLLFGKGKMYENEQENLFSDENKKEQNPKDPDKTTISSSSNMETIIEDNKQPQKIVVLFSDKTFTTYNSNN